MQPKENPGAVRTGARATTKAATHKPTRAHTQAPRAVYVLRVTFIRAGNDVSRLRAILKAMLRSHGLRALSVEPERAP